MQPIYFSYLFTLICVLNAGNTFACPALSVQLGKMTNDTDIEVGSSLDIVCSLYSSHVEIKGIVNSSDLSIKTRHGVLGNVKILDESSISWALQNASVSDTGLYQCLLKIPHVVEPRLVCATHVRVGYKPLPVSNFSCESINYTNLTCQWSAQPNPVRTKYTLRLNYPKFSVSCPKETVTASGCWWSLHTSPLYQQYPKELSFVLTGTNSLGSSKQHFSFNHSEIVKPGRPELHISVDKNNASLVFDKHNDMKYAPLHIDLQYQLCYTRGNSIEHCEIFEEKPGRVLKNLVPFTRYQFRLRSKSKEARSNMWGPFSKIKIIETEPDVPYLAPATVSSLFHSDVTESSGAEVSESSRTVTVYWKPVPKENYNGRNFCYIVSYYPCNNDLVMRRASECKRNYHQIGGLAVDQCYTFRICPINEIGMSSNCSYINVEAASNLLPPVDAITVVRTNQGSYSLSWKPPVSEDAAVSIYNYTVFWCRSAIPSSLECRGTMNWFYTRDNSAQLRSLDQDTLYNFAISANYGNATSGMKLATCVLLLNSSLPGGLNRLQSVIVEKLSSDSIEVKWQSNMCTPKNFKAHIISYCAVNPADGFCVGESELLNITEPSHDGLLINGLQPSTKYRIVLKAETTEGWHMESEPLYGSTFDSDIDPVPLIFGTVLVASFCIGIIVTIITGARRLKKRIDEEKSLVIKLPNRLNDSCERLTPTEPRNCPNNNDSSFKPLFQTQNILNQGTKDGLDQRQKNVNGRLIDMTENEENGSVNNTTTSPNGGDESVNTKTSPNGGSESSNTKTSLKNGYLGLPHLFAKNCFEPNSASVPCKRSPYMKVSEVMLKGTPVPNPDTFPKSPYISFDKVQKNSHLENRGTTDARRPSLDAKLYSGPDHYSRCGLRSIAGDPIDSTKRSASLGSLGLFKLQNPYVSVSYAANLNGLEDPIENEKIVLPPLHDGKFTINNGACGQNDQNFSPTGNSLPPGSAAKPACNYLPCNHYSTSGKFSSSPYISVNQLLERASVHTDNTEIL